MGQGWWCEVATQSLELGSVAAIDEALGVHIDPRTSRCTACPTLRFGAQGVWSSGVGMKPQYFDLTVMDVEAAQRFFALCLGWQFEPFDPIPGYYRIEAGGPDEPGIDGGIGAAQDFPQSEGKPLTLMTVPVPDIDEVIGKVERNGGRVIEAKRAIPGVGWFCTCSEPGGLWFGVLQSDPDAS